jgi:hypothetical protein
VAIKIEAINIPYSSSLQVHIAVVSRAWLVACFREGILLNTFVQVDFYYGCVDMFHVSIYFVRCMCAFGMHVLEHVQIHV